MNNISLASIVIIIIMIALIKIIMQDLIIGNIFNIRLLSTELIKKYN